MNLELILDLLQREKIRATYGAVAGVLGGIALGMMAGRENSHRNSWIVSEATGHPTGYRPDQMHPDLMQLPMIVLDSPEKLQRFLDRHLDNGN